MDEWDYLSFSDSDPEDLPKVQPKPATSAKDKKAKDTNNKKDKDTNGTRSTDTAPPVSSVVGIKRKRGGSGAAAATAATTAGTGTRPMRVTRSASAGLELASQQGSPSHGTLSVGMPSSSPAMARASTSPMVPEQAVGRALPVEEEELSTEEKQLLRRRPGARGGS